MGCGASNSQDASKQMTTEQPASSKQQPAPQQQQQPPPQPQKAAGGGGGGGNPALNKFREDVLAAHNKRRQWHQAPPVKLSEELNAIAQKWADHLAKAGKFEHSTKEHRNGAGENIAAHSNPIGGEEVVEMWYSEIKDYNFAKPGFNGNTGHFTQVVWKNCTHIGAGMSSEKGSNGMYMFVANYHPHGNMMGDFENNVLPRS